jgi:hypothetical protein
MCEVVLFSPPEAYMSYRSIKHQGTFISTDGSSGMSYSITANSGSRRNLEAIINYYQYKVETLIVIP